MCCIVKCVVKFFECVEKFLECVEKLSPYNTDTCSRLLLFLFYLNVKQ